MSYLRAVTFMILTPLLTGLMTLIGVRALNGGVDNPDDWVAVFLAMTVGALTWLVCWTWIRIQLRKEENK
jgi:hypothetical protein